MIKCATTISAAGLFFFFILMYSNTVSARPGTHCSYQEIRGRNSSRRYIGMCKLLKDCPVALSNHKAGIEPQICSDQPSSRGRIYVCCIRQKRVSESKCEVYTRARLGKSAIKKPASDMLNRIQAGVDANINQYPYMVALGYINGGKKLWACGGTLVSPSYVLTAAHCIHTAYGKPVRILLGDIFLEKKTPSSVPQFNWLSPEEEPEDSSDPPNSQLHSYRVIRAVERVFIHPRYRKPLKYNDIALVKLKKPVGLSRGLAPACLPSPRLRLEREKYVKVMGWGRIEYGGNTSDILQAADIERTTEEKCQKLCGSLRNKGSICPRGIQKSQICAGGSSPQDTCDGDSGGPLVYQKYDDEDPSAPSIDYVIGVTSFGSRICGVKGVPAVYTNVQSYLPWIEEIIWPKQRMT